MSRLTSVSRNLALNKPAWQSSTHPYDEYYGLDPLATLAVDGDMSSMYSDRSCTHTLHEDPRPWWTVDLLQEYMVTEVVITNRGDCCGNRFSSFWSIFIIIIDPKFNYQIIFTDTINKTFCETTKAYCLINNSLLICCFGKSTLLLFTKSHYVNIILAWVGYR